MGPRPGRGRYLARVASGAGPPLRVVIGIPHGTRVGGSERLLWSLLRDRVQAGLDPRVVAFEDGPFVSDIAALGVPTTVIDPGRFREPWRLAAAVTRLARLLRATRPDVCVSWLPRVQTVMGPAALAAGLRDRVVFFQHELADHDWLSRPAVALPCSWVLANSRASAESTRRLWPHRDGSVVLPGIEPPPRPSAEEISRLRSALGMPPGQPLLAVVGRLIPVKGIDRTIEALGLLRDQGADATLLVIGGPDSGAAAGHASDLRELASQLRLEDRVVFCGHVPEPAKHLAAADVVVHASVGDGFGLVVLEAMALEVPVVVAAGSGAVEAVEDGVSGVVVPTGAPAELAAAVARLIGDPERRAELAAAGRQRFEGCFTAERMVEQIGSELAAVAGAR